MGKMVGALAFAIAACCCADAGTAQPADIAPVAAYPDPQCAKPDLGLVKLTQLGDVTDAMYNARARAYNAHIKQFNQASQAYASCIHAYVEGANREVDRVQNQANSDIKRIKDNANAAMAAIQDKIRKLVAEGDALAAEQSAMAAALKNRAAK